jgi:hypothetical protein
MPIGAGDFSEGETLRARVAPGAGPMMRVVDGWDASHGYLRPLGVTAKASTDALAGTTPEQTPFAFQRPDDDPLVVARDSDEKLRTVEPGGGWSAAGDPAQR